MTLPVTFQGLTGTTYTDYVYIQKGRSESVLLFFNRGTPPSTNLVDRMSKVAAAQMKAG